MESNLSVFIHSGPNVELWLHSSSRYWVSDYAVANRSCIRRTFFEYFSFKRFLGITFYLDSPASILAFLFIDFHRIWRAISRSYARVTTMIRNNEKQEIQILNNIPGTVFVQRRGRLVGCYCSSRIIPKGLFHCTGNNHESSVQIKYVVNKDSHQRASKKFISWINAPQTEMIIAVNGEDKWFYNIRE